MNILYLISEYPKVSHSFVRREIQAIIARGHKVTRFAIRGWDLPLADIADQDERGQTCYVLQAGIGALVSAFFWTFFRFPRKSWRAIRIAFAMARKADRSLLYHLIYFVEACWIARAIVNTRIDHIHAHFGTNPAEVAALLSVLSGIPFSFTSHGPDEFDRPESLHLREKVALAKFAVTVSSFGRSQMLRWVRFEDWPKVKVVHCGVDASFLTEPLTPVPDNNRLVCVGRLSGQKGQLLLLEAMAQLKRAGVMAELVLAGDGEMRAEIEAAIRRLQLQDRVRITGWISNSQVKNEILQSRAMVLPSFAEGLPVVIMETMAVGRPVVSTYIAGIPELVQPDVNGWLCPAGSVDELAAVLDRVLNLPVSVLRAMAMGNRQRTAEQHNIDVEVEKLLSYIE